MPLDHFLYAAVTNTTDGPADPARINRAWVLFLILAILLTLFFLGIALLTISHRLRNRREEAIEADDESLQDPWSEAGKRATPYEEADDGPASDDRDDQDGPSG